MNANAESKIEAREVKDQKPSPPTALQNEAQLLLSDSKPKPRSAFEPDVLQFSNIYEQTRPLPGADQRALAVPARSQTSSFSLAESERPPTPRSWTVAVSLTTSMESGSGSSNTIAGAQGKLKEILSLAEQTRNSPVTIYIQAPESVGAVPGAKSVPERATVNTYRLEGGVVTQVASQPSAGLANDLAALLDRAGKRAGCGSLGLILQSHGVAEQGVFGDTGRASLEQLEASIRSSLLPSGRSQLDVLNFDSCLMGNSAVVASMQGEAHNIVASAETETVINGADGQNLKATLSALLASPNLSSKEFADRSVELARQGVNDDKGNSVRDASGTDTLASINVAAYQNFENRVNQLSRGLIDASQDSSNRNGIVRAINDTNALGSGGSANPLFLQRKDMGLILNQLEAGIRSGTIRDGDGRISQDIAMTRQSLKEMISQYHGEPYRNYSEMAGMSLTVPNRNMFDLKEIATSNSSIGQSIDFIQSRIKENDFSHKQETVELLASMVASLPKGEAAKSIEQQVKGLSEAKNERDFFQNLQRIRIELGDMLVSPEGQRETQSEVLRLRAQRAEIMSRQNGKLPPGWLDLMNSLSRP